MYKQLQDKQWLRERYVEKRMTLQEIADVIGCNKTTVQRALKRNGIARRKHTSKFYLLNDKDWLYDAYVTQRRSLNDIASEAGSTPGNVGSHLQALDIRRRDMKVSRSMVQPEGRHGKNAANWRGGRCIRNGYMFIYAPFHPNARPGKPYVQEHRLVMEKVVGRFLESHEIVHHLDGDRLNNSPENLELKTRGQHVSEHFKASHEVTHLRKRIADLEAENVQLVDEILRLKEELRMRLFMRAE